MNDKELIEGCLKGRKKAQDELYHRYSGRLFAICLRYTRDRMEAEDVLQEGFVKIFKKMDTFKNEDAQAIYPWMRQVMVNTTLNFLRDNKRHRLTESFDDQQMDRADESFVENVNELFESVSPAEILELIRALPDGYRTVFNLFAFEGCGHNEIAESLGISVNTSKTQLMKARRSLVSKLQEKIQSKTLLKLVI